MRVQEGYVRPVKAKKGHILPITNSGKDIAVQLKTYETYQIMVTPKYVYRGDFASRDTDGAKSPRI